METELNMTCLANSTCRNKSQYLVRIEIENQGYTVLACWTHLLIEISRLSESERITIMQIPQHDSISINTAAKLAETRGVLHGPQIQSLLESAQKNTGIYSTHIILGI